MALKRRQEEVAARKKMIEEKNSLQQKYLDEASMSSGRYDTRRQWEGREEEREKQREESLLLKDREKEVEAIKVIPFAY